MDLLIQQTPLQTTVRHLLRAVTCKHTLTFLESCKKSVHLCAHQWWMPRILEIPLSFAAANFWKMRMPCAHAALTKAFHAGKIAVSPEREVILHKDVYHSLRLL